MSEPSGSRDPDHTPPRASGRTFHERLQNLSDRYARQTMAILNTPGRSDAIAARVSEAFQPSRNLAPRPPRRNTRGRPTDIFQVRFFAVREPTTNRGQGFNRQDLAAYGLGDPPADTLNRQGNNELRLSWEEDQLREYIERLYPALSGVEFDLCYNPNRPGLEVLNATTPAEIKNFYRGVRSSRSKNAPRIIIRPRQQLRHQPLGTPTIQARRSLLSREQVAENSSTASHINESPQVTRQIREEQDVAYNESLRVDRERARILEESRRRENQRLRLEEERMEELRQLRESRRQAIPAEPDVGVALRIRFPNGETTIRRFKLDMPIDGLINTVGANNQSSREFRLHLPWTGRIINSRDNSEATLSDLGIEQSSTVTVEWLNDSIRDEEVRTPAASPVVEDSAETVAPRDALMESPPQAIFPESDHTMTPSDASTESPARISQEFSPVAHSSPESMLLARSSLSSDVSSEVSTHSTQSSLHLNLSADETTRELRVIQIRRQSILDDLIEGMGEEDMANYIIRIDYVGEQAVDDMGVFRDALTAFWEEATIRFFEGDVTVIPSVSADASPQTWRALGQIIKVGWRQAGYLPIRINIGALAMILLNQHLDADFVTSSWVETFGGVERAALLSRNLSGDVIVDIMARQGIREVPTSDNLSRLMHRCSQVEVVERPFFSYRTMGIRGTFETLADLQQAYNRLLPDGEAVSNMIRGRAVTSDQRQTLAFLVRAVRNMDGRSLQNFLRFVSGSNAVTVAAINANFVSLSGLGRRVVAHTCSVTLDLPVYQNYSEFRQELYAVINSGQWEMDFV